MRKHRARARSWRDPSMGKLWMMLLLVAGVAAFTIPALGGGDPTKGGVGKLFGTAKEDTDPENNFNEVISFDTAPVPDPSNPPVAGIERDLQKQVKVPTLDNMLETKYLFVGRTCGGGSPRFQLAIDTDGDGNPNGNAFGYLGDAPFGGGCPMGSWRYEDMTNSAPKWDLTQFGQGFTNTWDQVETYFTTAHPNHQVLKVTLIDDSSGFFVAGRGCAYFDLISLSNKTISEHHDVARSGSGQTNDC